MYILFRDLFQKPATEVRRVTKPLLFAVAFLLFCPHRAALSQSLENGTISGHITDKTGAPATGVTVTVTNKTTGIEFNVQSDKTGSYQISELPQGTYKVDALHSLAPLTVKVSNSNVTADLKVSVLLTEDKPFDHDTVRTEGDGFGRKEIPNHPIGTPGKTQGQQDYVRVAVNGVLGPMGYVETPSLTSANQMTGGNPLVLLASKNRNFPSIVLYISASPLVLAPQDTTVKSDIDNISAAQETDRNPEWLDATFTLTPEDEKGNAIENACTDGKVQVLGLLPQQTTAATKNQSIADAASAMNDVAGALASFYPGVQNQATAATKALNILFQDIFPPKPIAYQYSYINTNCEFGWFFRPNTSTTSSTTTGAASILGTQTGIILLQTDATIKQIKVSGSTVSSWNKMPTSYSKKLYLSPQVEMTFRLPDPKDVNYDLLTDLTAFPALISKSQAEKIVHIDNDKDWNTFVKSAKLVPVNDKNEYVTNASLSDFLTGGAAKKSADATKSGADATKSGTDATKSGTDATKSGTDAKESKASAVKGAKRGNAGPTAGTTVTKKTGP